MPSCTYQDNSANNQLNLLIFQRAIREIISNLVEVKQIDATKEQIDLFCLRVLATSSCTISYASSRTAVILAFGKRNLVRIVLSSGAFVCQFVFIFWKMSVNTGNCLKLTGNLGSLLTGKCRETFPVEEVFELYSSIIITGRQLVYSLNYGL